LTKSEFGGFVFIGAQPFEMNFLYSAVTVQVGKGFVEYVSVLTGKLKAKTRKYKTQSEHKSIKI